MAEQSNAQTFSRLEPIQYDHSAGSLQLLRYDLAANALEHDIEAEAPERDDHFSQLPEVKLSLLRVLR